MPTVYNVELDYVLIEKIVMRAVLAAVAYNCVIVQIYNSNHIAVTLDAFHLDILQNLLDRFILVIIHWLCPYSEYILYNRAYEGDNRNIHNSDSF